MGTLLVLLPTSQTPGLLLEPELHSVFRQNRNSVNNFSFDLDWFMQLKNYSGTTVLLSFLQSSAQILDCENNYCLGHGSIASFHKM